MSVNKRVSLQVFLYVCWNVCTYVCILKFRIYVGEYVNFSVQVRTVQHITHCVYPQKKTLQPLWFSFLHKARSLSQAMQRKLLMFAGTSASEVRARIAQAYRGTIHVCQCEWMFTQDFERFSFSTRSWRWLCGWYMPSNNRVPQWVCLSILAVAKHTTFLPVKSKPCAQSHRAVWTTKS